MPIADAERSLLAKEVGDDAIGRLLEAQHAMHELGLCLEQRGRVHRRIILGGLRPHSRGAAVTKPPSSRKAPPSHLLAHRRLLVSTAVGVAAALLWPNLASPVAQALVGWNVLSWLYLASLALTLFGADSGHIKRIALAQAESAAIVLGIVVIASVMSLVAVTFELIEAKAAGPQHMLAPFGFAFITVIGSWLLLPTLFALTYASAYYGEEPDAGLAFPGATSGFEPDHTDFLYFSFTIAVTAQTSDVSVTTRKMRRLVLVQSVLSFVFNTTILAFAINAAAGFFNS